MSEYQPMSEPSDEDKEFEAGLEWTRKAIERRTGLTLSHIERAGLARIAREVYSQMQIEAEKQKEMGKKAYSRIQDLRKKLALDSLMNFITPPPLEQNKWLDHDSEGNPTERTLEYFRRAQEKRHHP